MVKITPKGRLLRYPDNGFSVKRIDGKDQLWCGPCGEEVDFERTCVIDRHLQCAKHVKNKKEWSAQPQIKPAFENVINVNEEWLSMVHAFISAGIPLNVFRNSDLRSWLQKHLANGPSLPSVDTLRRRYLLEEGTRDLEKSKSLCRDNPILIMADETTDAKNRKVLNVLVKPADHKLRFRLVRTEFLEHCTSQKLVQSIIGTLTKTLTVEPNNILCFVSDNARYMLAAGRGLSEFSERFLHTTCWAHVLHLAAEEVRESLVLADQFISSVKQALVKSHNRREELYEALRNQGLPEKLPPTPVLTRWATWFRSGSCLFENFAGYTEWIQSTKPDSKAVTTLKEIVTSEELKKQLGLVNQLCGGLASTIRTLESNSVIASDVWLMLQTVDRSIEETIGLPSQKLRKYIWNEHPAKQFWNEVQFCDPRKIPKFFREDETWRLPDTLKIFNDTPVPPIELIQLKEIIRGYSYPSDFNVIDFWNQYSREMPILSKLSLRALSIPPSSAEVERSFSSLKRLLSSKRLNFKEENIDIHLRLQYNNRSTENEDDIENDDDDDEEET